jgi:hypothetical protein
MLKGEPVEGLREWPVRSQELRSITEKDIESKRTANGGFTKKQLAAWGVPWPPPRDWKKWILKYGIPYDGCLDRWRKGK